MLDRKSNLSAGSGRYGPEMTLRESALANCDSLDFIPLTVLGFIPRSSRWSVVETCSRFFQLLETIVAEYSSCACSTSTFLCSLCPICYFYDMCPMLLVPIIYYLFFCKVVVYSTVDAIDNFTLHRAQSLRRSKESRWEESMLRQSQSNVTYR